MLINSLQCMGPHDKELSSTSVVPRLRNPALPQTASRQEFKILADVMKAELREGMWAVTFHGAQRPFCLFSILPFALRSHLSHMLQILL